MPPKVSCVCPTTAARRWCLPWAIEYWESQSYIDGELVIVGDGERVDDLVPRHSRIRYVHAEPMPLGAKYNYCVEAARYPWIALWADDDWHAPWRLRHTMDRLLAEPGKEIAGLRKMVFHRIGTGRSWLYTSPKPRETPYFLGGSLVFHRNYWERHGFEEEASRRADASFTNDIDPEEYRRVAVVLDDPTFYVAMIHDGCTGRSGGDPAGPGWTKWPTTLGALIGSVAERYM